MEQNGPPTAAAIHRTGGTHFPPATLASRPPRPGMAVRVARPAPDRIEPGETISLTQPRPSLSRSRNEYIDAPLKGGLWRPSQSTPLHESTHIYLGAPTGKSAKSVAPPPVTSPSSLKRGQSTRRSLPVTKQPGSSTFTKEPVAVATAAADCATTSGRDSIICPECDRCRCEACRTARPLPQKWICGEKCLCSADAAVDYLSCLCCVKGVFYHCAGEEDSSSCADRPCSCAPPLRLARWTCLASLSVVLPCLLCYWPLKGCVKAAEKCYQRCHQRGCRCQPAPAPSAVVASKRLLDND